ncbi:Lsr2 family protein, partial [Actinomadura sp. CNU-125]|uniref:Lsr2 family protein n=1 Tax=Actinomadura sp. CNU-125 TaxID=1904961 RepID=UPI0021CC7C57
RPAPTGPMHAGSMAGDPASADPAPTRLASGAPEPASRVRTDPMRTGSGPGDRDVRPSVEARTLEFLELAGASRSARTDEPGDSSQGADVPARGRRSTGEQVRAWARANGRHVGSRGRIAKAIIDDYNWEHPEAPYDPDR